MSSGGAAAVPGALTADTIASSIPSTVLSKVSALKVKSCALCRGSMLKSTSKIQRFRPEVSLHEGIEWILSQVPDRKRLRETDATLIFENEASMHLQSGTFSQFDEEDDEDDDDSPSLTSINTAMNSAPVPISELDDQKTQ